MNPKKKIIIISVIFGAVSLILVFVVMFPLFKGIKKNSEEFVAAKKELILFGGETGELERVEKIYKKLEPDLERIGGLFIDPGAPIDLIKFWEKTAKDSQLSINISPVSLKAAETDPWKTMGFQITLIGSFPGFLKFLEKIETGPYLVEVQNLAVTESKEGGVSATLVIKSFY